MGIFSDRRAAGDYASDSGQSPRREAPSALRKVIDLATDGVGKVASSTWDGVVSGASSQAKSAGTSIAKGAKNAQKTITHRTLTPIFLAPLRKKVDAGLQAEPGSAEHEEAKLLKQQIIQIGKTAESNPAKATEDAFHLLELHKLEPFLEGGATLAGRIAERGMSTAEWLGEQFRGMVPHREGDAPPKPWTFDDEATTDAPAAA